MVINCLGDYVLFQYTEKQQTRRETFIIKKIYSKRFLGKNNLNFDWTKIKSFLKLTLWFDNCLFSFQTFKLIEKTSTLRKIDLTKVVFLEILEACQLPFFMFDFLTIRYFLLDLHFFKKQLILSICNIYYLKNQKYLLGKI